MTVNDLTPKVLCGVAALNKKKYRKFIFGVCDFFASIIDPNDSLSELLSFINMKVWCHGEPNSQNRDSKITRMEPLL